MCKEILEAMKMTRNTLLPRYSLPTVQESLAQVQADLTHFTCSFRVTKMPSRGLTAMWLYNLMKRKKESGG